MTHLQYFDSFERNLSFNQYLSFKFFMLVPPKLPVNLVGLHKILLNFIIPKLHKSFMTYIVYNELCIIFPNQFIFKTIERLKLHAYFTIF